MGDYVSLHRPVQTPANHAAARARPEPRIVGPGKPLPDQARTRMERVFGHDFSRIRVHQGDHPRALGALAYTQGDHLHFSPGTYRPDSIAGRKILAHELTHVVQQHHGRVAIPHGGGAPINPDSRLESEADRLGARAAIDTSIVSGRPDDSPRALVGRSPVSRSLHAPIQRKCGLFPKGCSDPNCTNPQHNASPANSAAAASAAAAGPANASGGDILAQFQQFTTLPQPQGSTMDQVMGILGRRAAQSHSQHSPAAAAAAAAHADSDESERDENDLQEPSQSHSQPSPATAAAPADSDESESDEDSQSASSSSAAPKLRRIRKGDLDLPSSSSKAANPLAAKVKEMKGKGLNLSARSPAQQVVASLNNRNPHTAGGIAGSGSARKSTHDVGNTQSIKASINRAVAAGSVTRTDFQPSQVRSQANAGAKDAQAAAVRQSKQKSKKASNDEAIAEFYGLESVAEITSQHRKEYKKIHGDE